ncbi:MAG: hypothetical protein GX062_06955, partial [Firmicutes bacterium]|nr:hypothetical protein [Bacillota bacterium]
EMSAEVAVDPFSQRTSTKVVTGTLRYRNQGSIVVTLASGAVAEYEVTAATQVLAGGRLSKLSAVQSGDTVLLHLPEPESSWVERIEVAGRAGRVTELYRGRLGSFSTRGGAIVLTRPERLVGDSWQEVGTGVLQLPLATSAVLWWGQQQLDLSTAARLTGQVAYVAAGNGFGRPEAMRVLVARGQEKAYTGRIKDINPVLGELALPAGEIALSPGAIILKDGRLADVLALTAADRVQALVEKGAAGSLGLVVTVLGQASAVPAELTIYKGEIDLVGSNAWTLRHYYTLEDNEWDYRGRRSTAELGLSRDTVILDLVDGTPRVLTLAEFRQGYHQRRFRRATVLAVSGEGDETLAAALWFEDELGAERLSAGRVTVISEGSDQVTFNLEDARDYSTARGEWRSTSEPQVLRLDTALVIKAGRGANWEELAVGDEVQVLRCGQSALLVLVKE